MPQCKQDQADGVALACLNLSSTSKKMFFFLYLHNSITYQQWAMGQPWALWRLWKFQAETLVDWLKYVLSCLFSKPFQNENSANKKGRKKKRVQGHRKHRLGALCEHFTDSNLPHSELCFIAQRLRAHTVEPDCLSFELAEGSSPFFTSNLIREKELIISTF